MHWRPRSAVHRPPGSRRRGAVALELLISVPVLVVMILAVIEFSMMFVAAKQVAMASRLGAKAASEPLLMDPMTFLTANQLRALVDRQLATAGSVNGACRVIAEYGLGNSVMPEKSDGNPGCDCAAPGTAGPMTGPFVRVTVAVRLSEFVPNLLSPYGFSITDRVLTHTTTFRREIP